ncbi:unnamed protein product, partial [Ectocarpus sp. 8 AP-2014]
AHGYGGIKVIIDANGPLPTVKRDRLRLLRLPGARVVDRRVVRGQRVLLAVRVLGPERRRGACRGGDVCLLVHLLFLPLLLLLLLKNPSLGSLAAHALCRRSRNVPRCGRRSARDVPPLCVGALDHAGVYVVRPA